MAMPIRGLIATLRRCIGRREAMNPSPKMRGDGGHHEALRPMLEAILAL
jgi:hypothetical protein